MLVTLRGLRVKNQGKFRKYMEGGGGNKGESNLEWKTHAPFTPKLKHV